MAGGMHPPRGSGTPLFLRGRQTASEPAPAAAPPSRRHCWVTDPTGQLHPGLILTWRKEPTGWTAHVTYLVQDRAITEWLPAARLSPIESHT